MTAAIKPETVLFRIDGIQLIVPVIRNNTKFQTIAISLKQGRSLFEEVQNDEVLLLINFNEIG